jgi:hypothetical protein
VEIYSQATGQYRCIDCAAFLSTNAEQQAVRFGHSLSVNRISVFLCANCAPRYMTRMSRADRLRTAAAAAAPAA